MSLCISEKAMAPHSSTLAWKIPGTREPGGLPSKRSHRVGHNWSNLATAAALCILVNTYIDSGSCQDSKVSLIITLFPDGSEGKASCLQCGRPGFDPWVGKILWRRKWQPTPVLLPGKSHGQRSMVGYSPRGCKESDTTERLHRHSAEKAWPYLPIFITMLLIYSFFHMAKNHVP